VARPASRYPIIINAVTIKAVLFDLDGTLYDRGVLVRQVACDQYDAFQQALGSISKNQFIKRVIELDDHGYGEKSELPLPRLP
jgi:putative hydrolase of the HAD superfamily